MFRSLVQTQQTFFHVSVGRRFQTSCCCAWEIQEDEWKLWKHPYARNNSHGERDGRNLRRSVLHDFLAAQSPSTWADHHGGKFHCSLNTLLCILVAHKLTGIGTSWEFLLSDGWKLLVTFLTGILRLSAMENQGIPQAPLFSISQSWIPLLMIWSVTHGAPSH